MKKAILMVTVIVFALAAAAQTSKQHYLDIYKRAVKYNDSRTAINALHGYLALGEEAAYKDTLGIIYYLSRDYYSALIISKEIYDADSKNIGALERMADCYNQLGDVKTALDSYEKLAPITQNPSHYYELALAQYQLKRIGECDASLGRVIADTNSKRIATPFNIGEGQTQNVPVMAAAYNVKAVLLMEVKNYTEARKMIAKALELYPDFVGAQQNLQALNRLSGTKPAPVKAPAPTTKPKGK
ncbi:MAG: tetratricopeptide repeat protein [Flavihumibacter sp.]|nr:tetratricopeptide repeat protein [Flavihumibacter sp.]